MQPALLSFIIKNIFFLIFLKDSIKVLLVEAESLAGTGWRGNGEWEKWI